MKRMLVAVGLLLTVASLAAVPAAAEGDPQQAKVPTYFRVLVGHPDPAPGGESVLVVPGTVLSSVVKNDPNADVLKAIDELKASYRLGSIEIVSSTLVSLALNQAAEVASVPGGPRISAMLMASDEKAATLKFSLVEGDKVLAEPVIRELRGGRAFVGTRNGPAAPYVFLMIEPFPALGDIRKTDGQAVAAIGVTGPKLVSKVQPAYPDEARKAKLEGVVLLECTIGADGRVKGCTAKRREPMGLTEAAIGAVAQWQFEPARDASGQALEVVMTFTIRFALA